MNEGELCAKHFSNGKPVCIRWKNGRITCVEEVSSAPENSWIAPALFDVQVNGYGGIDFQQDGVTVEELLSAVRQLRRDGCTQFFLTLITDEWSKLTTRLRHFKKLRGEFPELQQAIDTALASFQVQPEGYAGQFLRFHQALQTGATLPVTLQDARDSLELVTAMYRSARTGLAVQLPITSSDSDYQSWLP